MNTRLFSVLLVTLLIWGSLLVSINLLGIAEASTNVSGWISSNTTWTLAQSPIEITGDVRVAEGVLLKIESGVTVSFAGNYYFEVRGSLEAVGTSASPITFTPSSSSKQPDSWVGIRNWAYDASSYPHVRSKGNITLDYCTIEGSSVGVKGSLENDGTNNTSVIVTNSHFEKNGVGIYFTCREYSESYGYISHNTLLYNDAGITIENRYNSPALIVEDNTIALNGGNGISIQGYPYPGDTIVRHNLISGNSGSGLSVIGSHTHTQAHVTLTENTIISNQIGVYVQVSDIYTDTLVVAEVNSNNLYSNTAYDLKVGTSVDFPNNLNAKNNYWGTTNTTLIALHIYDSNDNWDVGTVDYVPFQPELISQAPDPALAPIPVIVITPTIAPTTSSGPESTVVPAPTPLPNSTSQTGRQTHLTLSADASSTNVGASVYLRGKLTDSNGGSLVGKHVIVSYSITGSASEEQIGSGITNDAGEYEVQWLNTGSGAFTLIAEWSGNQEYQRASASTILSFLTYENQNQFLFESNSTIKSLAFDSSTSQLSFSVEGPSQTTGYVVVTIAKDLVANGADIKVYLDGKELAYSIDSSENVWLLSFYYLHSTHQVSISLTGSTGISLDITTWIPLAITAVIITTVLLAVVIIIVRKRR